MLLAGGGTAGGAGGAGSGSSVGSGGSRSGRFSSAGVVGGREGVMSRRFGARVGGGADIRPPGSSVCRPVGWMTAGGSRAAVAVGTTLGERGSGWVGGNEGPLGGSAVGRTEVLGS